MKTGLVLLLLGLAVALMPSATQAHCEIPCGIYDDSARFVLIAEDITTIEKSMKQIDELSSAATVNYNQVVRWVTNKEVHANKVIETVTQYFLTQRIKPTDESNQAAYGTYQAKLTLCHQLIFYSMKAKQTTDLAHVEKLRELLAEFKTLYFAGHSH